MAVATLPPLGGENNPFVENKYFRWYLAIVSAPDAEGYTEEHHIHPMSLGGVNRKHNRVRLSFRKHYLAHWLLTKCTEGVARKKMLKAFGCMISNRRPHLASWQYEKAKIASHEGRIGQASPMKGRKHTPEALAKLSAAKKGQPSPNKGRQWPPEFGRKISAANKGMGKHSYWKGKNHSLETCEKIREAKTGVTYSSETRAKVSASLMGNVRKLGFKEPDETRRKRTKDGRRNLIGVCLHKGRYLAKAWYHGRGYYVGSFNCPAAAHFAHLIKMDKLNS